MGEQMAGFFSQLKSMFGGKNKELQAGASEFLYLVFEKSDEVYRSILQQWVQILVDNDLSQKDAEKIISSDKSKLMFTAGMVASQLLAAKNLLGEEAGQAFEKAVFSMLGTLQNPVARQVFATVMPLLILNRKDPTHTEVRALEAILVANGVQTDAFIKAVNDPISSLAIQGAIMSYGNGVIATLVQQGKLQRASDV